MSQPRVLALVKYDDPYVQPIILEAIRSQLPDTSYSLIPSLDDDHVSGANPILQFQAYEHLDFEFALRNSRCLVNAYVIRKALIRKHFLSNTILAWITKHPESYLARHFKVAVDFELDYAEFLEDALVEAYELHESFLANDSKAPDQREWWILKPGMSDRGQGIRLFSNEDELRSIFEQWDAEQDDSDAESYGIDKEGHTTDAYQDKTKVESSNGVITSQLRHFIAQPYIYPPLLIDLPPFFNRKFHIRTYVLAIGALQVYVYQPMLALFASLPYAPPWECFHDLNSIQNRTLTNTCVQSPAHAISGKSQKSGNVVHLFDHLPLNKEQKDDLRSQIHSTTSELFQASLAQATNFQPLPNSFEIFGVDFLIDSSSHAWLLEVNAFPDFAQTGPNLRNEVVQGLFEEVVNLAIRPFFGLGNAGTQDNSKRMVKVLNLDLGRA